MDELHAGPPTVRVLIIGNRFNEGLENLTKGIAAQANALIAPTQYCGDYYSYLHYLEGDGFRGERYSVGYARDKKYKPQEEEYEVVIYLSEPNQGVHTYHGEVRDVETIKVVRDLHYYYLTLGTFTPEIHVVHNPSNDRSDVINTCIDILTKAWR